MKNKEVNKRLEEIKNIIDRKSRNMEVNFIENISMYKYELTARRTDYGYEMFWNEFRDNYNLPEIKQYFKNYKNLLKVVYKRCIAPFNSRFDAISKSNKNNISSNFVIRKFWDFTRFVLNNSILFLVFDLSMIFLILSIVFWGKYNMLSNVLIGVSTSVIGASLVLIINRIYDVIKRKRLEK